MAFVEGLSAGGQVPDGSSLAHEFQPQLGWAKAIMNDFPVEELGPPRRATWDTQALAAGTARPTVPRPIMRIRNPGLRS
jgi:hypothetical protein